MKHTFLLVLLGALVVAAAPTEGASPAHKFIAGSVGDAYVVCDQPELGLAGIGGVCIRAGHFQPNALGKASISISDFSNNPIGGYYCQDLNADHICGGSGETSNARYFCQTITITSGVDWEESSDIVIRVNGPVFGTTRHDCASPAYGTFGEVIHSGSGST